VDMISILFRSMGNVFGLGFLCLCWFYYTLFKFQGTIINLMPSDYAILDDLYKNFALGFLGVFVGHLFLMFGQTSIDVFMIDWENRHELFRGAETVKAPISTWRVLFVGNQFARLQSARLTNFDFTCFAVLVLLTGLPSMTRNYYSASCITADGDDLDGCSAWAKSDFMRFAIFSFFWIAVEFIQVIYVTYVKQRYWKHPSKQLLDLMSLANISIWIMPDKYAGTVCLLVDLCGTVCGRQVTTCMARQHYNMLTSLYLRSPNSWMTRPRTSVPIVVCSLAKISKSFTCLLPMRHATSMLLMQTKFGVLSYKARNRRHVWTLCGSMDPCFLETKH